ncbi:ultraspiracle isoform 1, partial [Danaus plexippus plexippus]
MTSSRHSTVSAVVDFSCST